MESLARPWRGMLSVSSDNELLEFRLTTGIDVATSVFRRQKIYRQSDVVRPGTGDGMASSLFANAFVSALRRSSRSFGSLTDKQGNSGFSTVVLSSTSGPIPFSVLAEPARARCALLRRRVRR